MKQFLILGFLLFGSLSFANENSELISFNNISFEEFKSLKNSKIKINKMFKRQNKTNILQGTTLNKLINKFTKKNYLSLKIKRANEKENELKISFSKSSLAIKYMLD